MDLFLVYVICFGVGLLFTIITAFTSHTWGGHDADMGGDHAEAGTGGHAEAGLGTNDMPGFSAISPTSIASFITAFGGFGMIFSRLEATSHPLISVPLSTLSGLGIAAGVICLFRAVFRRTQSSSESRVASLVGVTATVITSIPEGGVGEIAYVQSGTRYTAPARTESGKSVGNGQAVKITRIIGTQFYVSAA